MNHESANDERSHAWIGVFVTVLAFAVVVKVPFFAPDSWSYLELSNTVFGDFYRVNTIRQFVVDEAYGRAFPPFWPVLIALVRRVFDIGIYAGVVINFAVCLMLLRSLIRLAKRLEVPKWVGTAIYLCLLACSAFVDDALAARNCVLALWLLTETLQILVQPKVSEGSVALAGLWMGLACLNRFDALPMALCVGLGTTIRAGRRGFTAFIIYFAMLAVVLSPWVAYSWTHFHTIWATDNSRQVLMAKHANVQNYYESTPPADLIENPALWLKGLATNKIPMAWKGLVFGFIHSITLLLLAIVLVIRAGGERAAWSEPARRLMRWSLFLVPLFVLPPTVVGYGDERYYLPVQLVAITLSLVGLFLMIPAWPRSRVLVLLGVLTIAVLPKEALRELVQHRGSILSTPCCAVARTPTAGMQEVANAVDRDAKDGPQRLLIYSFHPEGWDIYQYGALTGRPVSVVPRVSTGSFESYLRDWKITHVYDGKRLGKVADPSKVNLVPLELPGLYRVEWPK